jgi:hypothetical protein
MHRDYVARAKIQGLLEEADRHRLARANDPSRRRRSSAVSSWTHGLFRLKRLDTSHPVRANESAR